MPSVIAFDRRYNQDTLEIIITVALCLPVFAFDRRTFLLLIEDTLFGAS